MRTVVELLMVAEDAFLDQAVYFGSQGEKAALVLAVLSQCVAFMTERNRVSVDIS